MKHKRDNSCEILLQISASWQSINICGTDIWVTSLVKIFLTSYFQETPLSLVYPLHPLCPCPRTYNTSLLFSVPTCLTPPLSQALSLSRAETPLLIFVTPVPNSVTGSGKMPYKYWLNWFEVVRLSEWVFQAKIALDLSCQLLSPCIY